MANSILLIDDDPQILLSSSILLRTAGINDVLTIEDAREVMPLLQKQDVAVVVLDLSMPHVSGIKLLEEIKHEFPQIPVIIMTAKSELETAVECMKAGAFDYIVKPADKERFISSVRKALELYDLKRETSLLKQRLLTGSLEHETAFAPIITNNKRMHAILQYVEVIAASKQPVLVTGETGVGKELIAQALHNVSGCKGPFVAVNVAGLDDTMFSDAIFGHRKGAYTGAEQAREGFIVAASNGTLFLDEIGDLSLQSQVKLLRLLQEGKFYPLGADLPVQCSARIVVSTNHDLQQLISSDRFRKDLYYRLRSHHIHLPPLRERLEDIPALLECFLEEAAKSMGKKKPAYPPELITLLSTYHFPGNIRELRAMVFDAVTRHKSGVLSMDSFKEIIRHEYSSRAYSLPSDMKESILHYDTSGRFPTLKEAEEFLISEALRLSKGNQGIAASLLGITRQALNKRLIRNNKSHNT